MCLSEEDEPSANPVVVNHENKNQSLIIRMGTKGKYVGILGVYKTGNPAQPFKFRYTIEQMSEDYLTPESAKKNHPVMELMESYAKELKNENYLSRFGQARHPVQVSAPNSGQKNARNAMSRLMMFGKNHPIAMLTRLLLMPRSLL
jgi:hypothetical protein